MKSSRLCWKRPTWRIGATALVCALVAGCCRIPSPPPAYWGPTLPLNALVQQVDQNSGQIPTLRGTGHYSATFRDGDQKRSADGDLTLLFSRPRSIRLILKYGAVGTIMDVAGNDDQYWVIVGPRDDANSVMYWGTYANLDRVDSRVLPIRPDLLMEVLGTAPIDTNFLAPPVPVMRFNNDADAYMLVWTVPEPDRWIAQKEIWYDRATLLPKLVLLFDKNGRIVLRAYLSKHKPIEVQGKPREQWPQVATHYDLLLPEDGSKLVFDLDSELAIRGGRPPAPNERSFVFPGEDAGVAHVKPLDPQINP